MPLSLRAVLSTSSRKKVFSNFLPMKRVKEKCFKNSLVVFQFSLFALKFPSNKCSLKANICMLCHVHRPGWVMYSPLNCISSFSRFRVIYILIKTVDSTFSLFLKLAK